ncbi:MAG: hypothetical protein K2X99_02060 [Gemmatimonadaceae bacterium]|nr:hypothetical protein [Gemmatimonadaceae bacterium]
MIHRPWLARWVRCAWLVLLLGGAASCAESLDAGATCPTLCASGSLPLRDTTITPALAWDSTLTGFPDIGTEFGILVATRGDSLDARAVFRFDSTVRLFAPVGDTVRPISQVDSARLLLRLDVVNAILPDTVVIEAFDVDTTSADTLPNTLVPLFRASRLLGSVRVPRILMLDSLRVPLDNAKLLAKLRTPGARVRIGIRATGATSVQFRLQTSEIGQGATLAYRATPDTAVRTVFVLGNSSTPKLPDAERLALLDYGITVKAPAPGTGAIATVGGLPARRAYLRFNLPTKLIDSTQIVRATLYFTQQPARGIGAKDTLSVYAQPPIVGSLVSDIRRQASFLAPLGIFVNDSIRLAAGDSGTRSLEVVNLLRGWKGQSGTAAPVRALVLRASTEGNSVAEFRFASTTSPIAALRPRIRISYVGTPDVGVP